MSTIEQSLLDEVKRHHWYQSIPLDSDYTTPGETGDSEQRKLEMMQLPEDLRGKTVLDIGCNEGFFSFEVERRGAERILAVDKSSAAEEKFNLVKKIFGSKVEFKSLDLLDTNPPEIGRFDIVFFLAVLHHMRHPLLALDRVYELTKEYALIEYVEAVPQEHKDLSALVRKMSKKGHLHMLPTRQFALEVLTHAGFKKIDLLGEHRFHRIREYRKMPGFDEQRVLLKAFR